MGGKFISYGVLPGVVCALLKKHSLEFIVLGSFPPVSNLLFLDKVIEQIVVSQCQRNLGVKKKRSISFSGRLLAALWWIASIES